MKVLGVSGSPIPNSNTDQAVKVVLDATGLESEFVKLTDVSIAPCKGCLGCLKTNRCTIQDDGIEIAEKVKNADALVVGGFTPYSTLDSRTKAFLERLYPLRHNQGFMRGKPGVAVATTAVPEGNTSLPPAGKLGADAITFYMMEEGMNFLGSAIIYGNVPCIKCGYGDECEMSAIPMIYGPGTAVETVGVNKFNEQPAGIEAATELGKKIAATLQSN